MSSTVDPGTARTALSGERLRSLTRTGAERYGVVVVAILLVIGFRLTSDIFLSEANVRNIFMQSSVVGVAAVGATIVMLTGGIDLSVGGVVLLSEVVVGTLAQQHGAPAGLAVVAGIGAGLGIGALNGFLVAMIGIEPILATLATLMLAGGLGDLLLGEQYIQVSGQLFTSLATTNVIGDLPIMVGVMFAVYGIGAILMQRAPFGRSVYALGNNRVAARLAGLPVRAATLGAYAVAGALSGLAGVLNVGQLGIISQNDGVGMEFQAITAALVGGLSVAVGGVGRIERTFVGVLIVAMITNYQTIRGVAPNLQQAVLGGLVLVAIVADRLLRGRET